MVFENAGGFTPRIDDEFMESKLSRLGSYSPDLMMLAAICDDLMKTLHLSLYELSMSLNDH
jgi:hypothetical protein